MYVYVYVCVYMCMYVYVFVCDLIFVTSKFDEYVMHYTAGILQRLDTDVHSAVTAKTSTALRQRKRVQRCDSENEYSAVTAKTSTAL